MRAVAFDPRTPNRVLAGTASGGLWSSNDLGTTWQEQQRRMKELNSYLTTALDPAALEHLISSRRGHSQRGGWGFLLPAVIVLFALTIFPFIFTVVLSLSNVDLTAGLQVQPGTLANWQQLIGDAQFWGSLGMTCLFVALAVVSEYILGFGLALLLWRDLRGGAFFRVIFLIPMMLAPPML